MSNSEDRELFGWCTQAMRYGGSFVKAIAQAARFADDANYALLRPTLMQLKAKYPNYDREEIEK